MSTLVCMHALAVLLPCVLRLPSYDRFIAQLKGESFDGPGGGAHRLGRLTMRRSRARQDSSQASAARLQLSTDPSGDASTASSRTSSVASSLTGASPWRSRDSRLRASTGKGLLAAQPSRTSISARASVPARPRGSSSSSTSPAMHGSLATAPDLPSLPSDLPTVRESRASEASRASSCHVTAIVVEPDSYFVDIAQQ